MKYLLAFSIFLFTSSVFAQKLYTCNESIPITQDSITIQAGSYKGNIQWQKSLDSKNWLNLDGKTSALLKVKPDTEAMYRAKVTEGNCLPVYSDSAWIVFTVPEVSTSIAKDIKYNSAFVGGNILSNGGATVSEQGVCYSLTQIPTVTNSKIVISTGIGEFNDTIRGLTPNTTYYARAYAINSKGIAYGNLIQVTTSQALIFTVSKFVDASSNDSIVAPDKTVLVVPSNSLQTSGNISIGITGKEPKDVPNQNLQIVGKSYTLEFPGDTLLHSVRFSYPLPSDAQLDNYSLFLYNGNSFIPIKHTLNGNTVTANIDIIKWGASDSLKSDFLLSSITLLALEIKQKAPPTEVGLKQVTILANGELHFDIPSTNSDSKILLLIHGITSSPSNAWKTFIKDVTLKIPSYTKVWTFGYDSNLSIDTDASTLKNALETAISADGIKVDIVAHSMGGLVSRAMIENYGGAKYVNKLITLGTPHLGSPAAAIRDFIGFIVSLDSYFTLTSNFNSETEGLRDLKTTSTFIQNLKNNTNPPIPYYLIAATNNPSKLSLHFNASLIIPGLDDGAVAVSSAQGASGYTNTSIFYIDDAMAHTQMTNIDNLVYPQVLTYLRLSVPNVTTLNISNIKQNSATGGGVISSSGGAAITTKGICWSTSPNPTIDNSKTNDGNGSSTFTSYLTGLGGNTTYYVRAYAINSQGTSYGNQINFKTAEVVPSETVTDIDGNVYHTVTIGSQVWMVENLKTTRYNDGTSIPNVTNNTAWLALTTGGYCWYNNDAATYKGTYGALYNWFTIGSVKLCPIGWHIPSYAEIETLETFLGGQFQGGKMKESGTLHWLSPNSEATNSSGFTGLPGGRRQGYGDGAFYDIGKDGYFWSSSDNDIYINSIIDNRYARMRFLIYNYGSLGNGISEKQSGYSVRCIKD